MKLDTKPTISIHLEHHDDKDHLLKKSLDQPITIGRDPTCDIVFDSPNISRVHAILTWTNAGLEIEDVSSNGIWIHDKHVLKKKALLTPPTRVRIGTHKLHIATSNYGEQSVATDLPVQNDTDQDKAALRKAIHRKLLDHLDLANLDKTKMNDRELRPKVMDALGRIVGNMHAHLPKDMDRARLIHELSNEVLGLGPLEELLSDNSVNEIMVVDPQNIFVERAGQMIKTDFQFTDDEAIRAVIERIVTPLGRRIDESTPLVDARLQDGSRVNAVIRPLAIRGACITIRKFSKDPLSMQDLVQRGSFPERIGVFLDRTVKVRKNVVISGGTGSGKTTLLNVLSGAIPSHERIITIEDAAELRLQQPHVVSLETRPSNMEGRGAYTIRDLVKNALRMRPDRIVVGECRGGEALDMLQAMNTGHEGSMTTTHANSPMEAVSRLETLALMSGLDLPARAIREQIVASVDIILQQTRFSDGSRRITHVTEVIGLEDGEFQLKDIFVFKRTGTAANGKIEGEFRATGYLPSYIGDFITHGLISGGRFL